MNMMRVKSNAVTHIGHDPATNTLRVTYRRGATYDYDDFSADDHQALLDAESIGSHLHRQLREKNVRGRAVEEPQPAVGLGED